MPIVAIENNPYYYKVSKRGLNKEHAAVCLHGSGAEGIVWGYQLSRLSRYFKIIVPDLPGHGKSGGPALGSAAEYAGWLERFIAELGLSCFFLLGHSFGGAIVQEFARAYPDKLKGLVLVGTGTSFKLSKMYRKLHEQGIDFSADRLCSKATRGMVLPEPFKKGYEMLRKNSSRTLHADLLAAAQFDSSPWISSVKLPTLVVWGNNDMITPRKLPQDLAGCLPAGEFRIIQDAGHVVMLDARDEFNEAIKGFMEKQINIVPEGYEKCLL
jgi:pimeloyl-ACP methyl ester carboxylesterase